MHSEICEFSLFQCPYVSGNNVIVMTVVVVVKMVCDGLVDD